VGAALDTVAVATNATMKRLRNWVWAFPRPRVLALMGAKLSKKWSQQRRGSVGLEHFIRSLFRLIANLVIECLETRIKEARRGP
jgi:hypothetical protein